MKLHLICILIVLGSFSCKSGDFQTTDSGLQYQIYTENEGQKPKIGDYVKVHVIMKTDKDSVISNTYEMGEPLMIRITEPMFQGDPMEGFLLLTEGDSATFLVSADSMAQGQELLPNIDPGSLISFNIKLVEVLDAKEYAEDMKQQQMESVERSKILMTEQSQVIEQYLQDNNLEAQKSPSGLYYIIEEPGTGETPSFGDKVSVNYRGYLLDGTEFDNSYDRGQPISFPIGYGQVIPGWDEGLMLFKEGGKGKLLIPSPLAYGERQTGPIPANSILIFDIELVGVERAQGQGQ